MTLVNRRPVGKKTEVSRGFQGVSRETYWKSATVLMETVARNLRPPQRKLGARVSCAAVRNFLPTVPVVQSTE